MSRIIPTVTLSLITAFATAALAVDSSGISDQTLVSEEEFIPSADLEKHPKSINNISLENYLLTSTGSIGLKSTLPGPLSIASIRQLATPLYEEPGYGLYAYQHFKAHVWYQGNFASVILLMQYPGAGR